MRAASSEPGIEVTTSWPKPDVCLVVLAGELDMSTTPLVRDHLHRRASARPALLVLDLTAVTFLAAAGVTLLLEVSHDDDGRQGRLHVVAAPDSPVLRALRLTGTNTAFRIHGHVDEALAATGRP